MVTPRHHKRTLSLHKTYLKYVKHSLLDLLAGRVVYPSPAQVGGLIHGAGERVLVHQDGDFPSLKMDFFLSFHNPKEVVDFSLLKEG